MEKRSHRREPCTNEATLRKMQGVGRLGGETKSHYGDKAEIDMLVHG